MTSLAIALHALAAALWVGGMAFAHFCLRPAALSLDPPHRLPLMAASLGRFFPIVWGSIAVLLASGYLLMLGYGVSGGHVHAMQATGVVMMLLFAHLYFAPFRRLKLAVAAADWPAGAKQLATIRLIVTINLVLGLLTIAVGASGRYW